MRVDSPVRVPGRWTRGRLSKAAALLLLLPAVAACIGGSSDGPPPAEPSITTLTLAPTEASTTTSTLPPVLVDIGVELESSIISLGVVSPRPAALAGHEAYWGSIATDLGGVGGRFKVELAELPSATAASSSGVLAISLDNGPPEPVTGLLAIAPSQTIESREAGRTLDVTRPSLGQIVAAAAALAASPEFGGEGTLGVAAGDGCPFDPMTYQLTEGEDADFVLVCGTPEAAAAALPGLPGVALLTDAAWDPALPLEPTAETYVLGALPPPGPEAPAMEILARAAGPGPWDPDYLRGYTAALTVHLALERALAEMDLTREGVLRAAEALAGADLGFGTSGGVTVSRPEPESPTGLALVDVVAP